MENSNRKADQGRKTADFVGMPDPHTNILILWLIKENEPKTLFLKYLPEMTEELKRMTNISDRMEVVMHYFCGNIKGRFMTGFYAFNPRDQRDVGMAIDNTSRQNNPFVMFRAIRALKCFSRIDYPDDMMRAMHAFDSSDKDYKQDKEWLVRIIGNERYEEIAKDIPPALEIAVDTLLMKGVSVDKTPFEAEIRRGLITSRSLMKTLKIPTPEDEKERMIRLEKMVAPYWEYALYYFAYKNSSAIGIESEIKLKKYIYDAIARGIDGYIDAVAIAIIRYHREAYVRNNKLSGTKDVKSAEIAKMALIEVEYKITKQIAEEFADCFKEKIITPKELFSRYDNYLRNMDIVEPVDLLG